MSLVIDSLGFPVHMPRDRGRFEFDNEVTAIFENMAVRSIPNYVEMHRTTAEMIMRHRMDTCVGKDYVILDFGASTGVAAKMLCNQLQLPLTCQPQGIRYIAVDNSMAMLDKLKNTVPWAEAWHIDLEDPLGIPVLMDRLDVRPNAILMLYFMQFLKPQVHWPLMHSVHRMLTSGGLFFFGAKEAQSKQSKVGDYMDAMYYQLRRDNGYSQEEIDAKTRALKGSMHTSTRSAIINTLDKAGFRNIHEMTRWLQFMSLVAVKTRKT